MKKFKFKLQGLLRLRELKEHQEKIALARINTEIADSKDRIKKTQKEIEIAYKSLDELTEEGVEGQMISFFPRYIKAKREYIKQQEQLIEQLTLKHTKQISILAHAKGEVKVIENMKDKAHEKFRKEEEKKEQEKIDDIMMARQAYQIGRKNESY